MKLAVVGAGRIGRAVAAVARGLPPAEGVEVTLFDARGADVGAEPLTLTPAAGAERLSGFDAVVATVPPAAMRAVAALAARLDVPVVAAFESTDAIAYAKANRARWPAALCSGGSPGLLGAAVMRHVEAGYTKIRAYAGALPARPTGRISWMATWSPEGMIAQYTRLPVAIRGGRPVPLSPMQGRHVVHVGRDTFEAAWVAGGLGSLVETLAGRDVEVVYHALRWPGHFDAMDLLLGELRLREDPRLLAELLLRASPREGADVFHLVVTPEGDGELPVSLLSVSGPLTVGNEKCSAVGATTACALWVHAVALAGGAHAAPTGAFEEIDVAATAAALQRIDPDATEVLDAITRFASEVPRPEKEAHRRRGRKAGAPEEA